MPRHSKRRLSNYQVFKNRYISPWRYFSNYTHSDRASAYVRVARFAYLQSMGAQIKCRVMPYRLQIASQTNFKHSWTTHEAHRKSPLVIPTFAADLCSRVCKEFWLPKSVRDSASLRRKSQENTSGNTPNGARSPPRPEIHPEAAPISGRRARPDKQAGLNPTGGARYYVDRASRGAVEEARLVAASRVAPNCGNRGS